MKNYWKLEPDRIVLKCHQCGETIILLGYEENWHIAGNIFFECQCGQRLTIGSKL